MKSKPATHIRVEVCPGFVTLGHRPTVALHSLRYDLVRLHKPLWVARLRRQGWSITAGAWKNLLTWLALNSCPSAALRFWSWKIIRIIANPPDKCWRFGGLWSLWRETARRRSGRSPRSAPI